MIPSPKGVLVTTALAMAVPRSDGQPAELFHKRRLGCLTLSCKRVGHAFFFRHLGEDGVGWNERERRPLVRALQH